ncbi:MAG: drug:proton antiporter [Hyphomicrobiales bacterium]|nr:VOC family protein [Hyphomicrobiales bacterium]PCJ93463.1 MAG: drug:proton antiporter [Hyphomicrobiales bacterium]
MINFNFLILYVDDAQKSSKFYTELLGVPIAQEMDGFAMMPLREGVMLGLWSKDQVEPKITSGGGNTEICFDVADADELNALHDNWKKRGLPIVQAPTQMDFGLTFVATDPDGHRLRPVFPKPQ